MRSWSLATFPSTTRSPAQRNRGVDDGEMVKPDRIAVCFDIRPSARALDTCRVCLYNYAYYHCDGKCILFDCWQWEVRARLRI